MRLSWLALSNVRNYASLDFQPAPGLNVFIGANAQGKSNLLEAISLLGTGKSFRTNREADLIASGFQIASVSGGAHVRAGSVNLGCTVMTTARGTRKAYSANGRAVRYAAFLGTLNVVTFVPADLQLIAGAPSGRRRVLNGALAQEQPLYYRDLVRYQKALAQKSALLRSADEPDAGLMAVYNETLVSAGTALMLARGRFVTAANAEAQRAHAAWSGGRETLELRYEPNVPYEVPTGEAIGAALAQRLRTAAAAERARRIPLAGPHRDDLGLLLDGRSLAAYGSQGQQRTAVLALKVAEYTVMHQRTGEAPLLLLDDVLSELDADRARAFLEGVEAYEQAFVTATHLPHDLPQSRVFTIEAAVLREIASPAPARAC